MKLWFLIITFFLFTCNRESEDNTPPVNSDPDPLEITIDPGTSFQTIAGFGGANRMWGTQFLKPAEASKAFGTNDTDLGLSIFRVRIASNKDEWPLILESVQEAQNHGVKILASPWSPPAELKSNGSDIGGFLLEINYQAFAEHINDFIQYMSDNGVDIYAISIQNEPDIQVSYESCDWTAPQMCDFLKDYGQLITGTKIAAPESFNFNKSFSNTLLNDDESAENIDIVAGHIYGGGQASYPLAAQKGKEIWMTEYLLNLNVGNSGESWQEYSESAKWEESLVMLNTVHLAMANDWNAYIWWYLQRFYSFIGDGEEGTASGEILKRGYAFSQFSKYIRPGYTRIDIQSEKSNDLLMTAYQGDDQIVVVIINLESKLMDNLNFIIEGSSASSAAAYTTSLNANREEKEVELEDGKVVMNMLPESITTLMIQH